MGAIIHASQVRPAVRKVRRDRSPREVPPSEAEFPSALRHPKTQSPAVGESPGEELLSAGDLPEFGPNRERYSVPARRSDGPWQLDVVTETIEGEGATDQACDRRGPQGVADDRGG